MRRGEGEGCEEEDGGSTAARMLVRFWCFSPFVRHPLRIRRCPSSAGASSEEDRRAK